MHKLVIVSCTLFFILNSTAQSVSDTLTTSSQRNSSGTKWHENIRVRGYMQARYNRLLETNSKLGCEQCDKSWGDEGGLSLRRARVVLDGQISKRVYFYFQTDFASSINSQTLNIAQLRDAYVDIGVDDKNEFRFRVGQSKIPYGFENLQSSQNRIPLDRNDALNSAFSNERDMGVFFYWAPETKRNLFAALVRNGLKGSGDYGVFSFGIFNGQNANKPDQNKQLHVVSRLSYPFKVGNHIIEPGIQAYTGKYVVTPDQTTAGVKFKSDRNYIDQRVAASFVLYPKPWGIQAEYNIGRGPRFNPTTDSIETRSLNGGYITVSYLMRHKQQVLIPFIRGQYYNGGKKHEQDARSFKVHEWEIGVEWQPMKEVELVAMYTISSRRYEDFSLQNNLQRGNLLRLQAQFNF